MTPARRFEALYGRPPSGTWAAPGRVNLIGEHTDYNDGFVLPIALDRTARVAVRLRDDDVIRCASVQQGDDVTTTSLGSLVSRGCGSWAAYVAGVAWALAEHGVRVSGFDLLLDSDVPVGAGLSSSAAIETATGLALAELLDAPLTRLELALVCHRAETGFVGAPVGVMDQVASACASAGHALLLDCRSLEVEHVPFRPQDWDCELLVVDTGAPHQNNDGAYAERRASCERAAADLGVKALRDASPDQVADLPRARHVVSECRRVLSAAEALRDGDAARLGQLMLASHVSLRDDFEVSSPQLDLAVTSAMGAGAHGARLTGAGFGGCAVALVPRHRSGKVAMAVADAFADRAFDPPDVFPVAAGPGATRAS